MPLVCIGERGTLPPMTSDVAVAQPQAPQAKITRPRLWEVDVLRGLAVVAMAFFHFMWDLFYLRLTDVNVYSDGWQLLARSIGTTFMFVMGVSLTLDAARLHNNPRELLKRQLRRGLIILACGMAVTVGTLLFAGQSFVRFGILHLAGTSIILAYPFVRAKPWLSALAGVVVVGLATVVGNMTAANELLVPLGILPRGIDMVDYYPLIPWFGVVLLGIAAGQVIYPNGVRRFSLPDLGGNPISKGLRFLGRNSLVFYLLHQPVLIGLLMAYAFITGR